MPKTTTPMTTTPMTTKRMTKTQGALALIAATLWFAGCSKSPSASTTAAEPTTTTTVSADSSAALGAGAAKAEAVAAVAAVAKVPKQTVLIWHAYRDAEREGLDALVSQWNRLRDDIEIQALAVPYDALIDKTQVAIPRGNGPDLVIIAHDKIGIWARDGLIAPLGDFATPDRLRRFLPITVKPLVFERAVYGLPLAFKSLAMFYNRALVEKPPATIAELVAVGKKLTNAAEGRFGLAYDAADLYYHAAWLHAYGGSVFDDDRHALAIHSPEAIAAANAVAALFKDDAILGKGMTGFIVTATFNDGKVPFVFNGPWFINEIDPSVKWGVAPMPTAANGKPLAPYLGSEALLLSAHTKVKNAALTVLDYLTSDEAALTRLRVGHQMVANTKIYENPEWSKDPVVRIFRAQADHAVAMSNSIEAGVAWAPYSNALRRIIFAGADADAALLQADTAARAALEKMRK